MSEPYLIVHVVRSEPAFDIAIRCDDMGTESDPAPWWIIPTSGHRAYPYWIRKLWGIADPYFPDIFQQVFESDPGPVPDMPDPWPDHYPTAAEPRHSPTAGRGLLARLGLLRKTTIKRRV